MDDRKIYAFTCSSENPTGQCRFLAQKEDTRHSVATAFDSAVASHPHGDRLPRKERQIQLTAFVLNNHSNSFKSHCCTFSRVGLKMVPQVGTKPMLELGFKAWINAYGRTCASAASMRSQTSYLTKPGTLFDRPRRQGESLGPNCVRTPESKAPRQKTNPRPNPNPS